MICFLEVYRENLSCSRWSCLTLCRIWGEVLEHTLCHGETNLSSRRGREISAQSSVLCRTSSSLCSCMLHTSFTAGITQVGLVFPYPAERVISSVTVKWPVGPLMTVSNYLFFFLSQRLCSSSRVVLEVHGCYGITFVHKPMNLLFAKF